MYILLHIFHFIPFFIPFYFLYCNTWNEWKMITCAGKLANNPINSNSDVIIFLQASRITPCKDFCCSFSRSPSHTSTFPLAMTAFSNYKKILKNFQKQPILAFSYKLINFLTNLNKKSVFDTIKNLIACFYCIRWKL